jgi:hypothetical protein
MINPAKDCTIDAPEAPSGKVNNVVNGCADPELGVRSVTVLVSNDWF